MNRGVAEMRLLFLLNQRPVPLRKYESAINSAHHSKSRWAFSLATQRPSSLLCCVPRLLRWPGLFIAGEKGEGMGMVHCSCGRQYNDEEFDRCPKCFDSDLRLGNETLPGQTIKVSDRVTHTSEIEVVTGYEPLAVVLMQALDQAQSGKGKERHATDRPFLGQPIMQLRRMVGSGYTLGQAMKKAQESQRLPADQAEIDLLGAINYLAAEVLARREEGE